jgi:hypothetical protein
MLNQVLERGSLYGDGETTTDKIILRELWCRLENRHTYSLLFTRITPSSETLSITFRIKGQNLCIIIKILSQFERFGVRQKGHADVIYSDKGNLPSQSGHADLTVNI